MVVGTLFVEMHIPGATSLKAKRRVLQSIKANVRNRYNVSISEIDFQDLWQRSAIGVAAAGPDRIFLEKELHSVLGFIDENPELEITRHEIEFFR